MVLANWFASMEVIIDLLLQTETAGLMLEMVNSLLEQFSIILQPPLQSEDPDEWSMRLEVNTFWIALHLGLCLSLFVT